MSCSLALISLPAQPGAPSLPTPSCPLLPGPAQEAPEQGCDGRQRLGLWPWQPPAMGWGHLAVPGMVGDQR